MKEMSQPLRICLWDELPLDASHCHPACLDLYTRVDLLVSALMQFAALLKDMHQGSKSACFSHSREKTQEEFQLISQGACCNLYRYLHL